MKLKYQEEHIIVIFNYDKEKIQKKNKNYRCDSKK